MKKLVFILISTYIASTVAFGQGSISSIVLRNEPIVVRYRVEESVILERSEIQAIISLKEEQYDHMIKAGEATESQKKSVINSLKNMSTARKTRAQVQFNFFSDHLLVTWANEEDGSPEAWTWIDSDTSVSRGWQGGDSAEITAELQPYTNAATKVPILPIQLKGVKSFVDLSGLDKVEKGKMLSISTSDSGYHSCNLQFQDGRLSVAEIPGIERWTYASYIGSFPKEMNLERQYSKSNTAQVSRAYTSMAAKADSRTLEELLGSTPIQVIDQRVDPPRVFTFTAGKGSFDEQLKTAKESPEMKRPELVEVSGWGSGRVLILLGFAGITCVSVYMLIRGLRGHRGK